MKETERRIRITLIQLPEAGLCLRQQRLIFWERFLFRIGKIGEQGKPKPGITTAQVVPLQLAQQRVHFALIC